LCNIYVFTQSPCRIASLSRGHRSQGPTCGQCICLYRVHIFNAFDKKKTYEILLYCTVLYCIVLYCAAVYINCVHKTFARPGFVKHTRTNQHLCTKSTVSGIYTDSIATRFSGHTAIFRGYKVLTGAKASGSVNSSYMRQTWSTIKI
jgi:hypothetical protein